MKQYWSRYATAIYFGYFQLQLIFCWSFNWRKTLRVGLVWCCFNSINYKEDFSLSNKIRETMMMVCAEQCSDRGRQKKSGRRISATDRAGVDRNAFAVAIFNCFGRRAAGSPPVGHDGCPIENDYRFRIGCRTLWHSFLFLIGPDSWGFWILTIPYFYFR